MKLTHIILFTLFMGLSLTAFSQSSNQVRLTEIAAELDAALEKGDYDKAAKLKEERDIRIEIEGALKNQDFEKAETLKASLSGGAPKKETQQTSAPKAEKPVSSKPSKPVQENATSSGNGKDYLFKRGFMLDFMVGFGSVSTTSTISSGYPHIGLAIGNKWYFGKNQKYRPGLQVNWARVGVYPKSSGTMTTINPLNLGVTNVVKFSDNIGIEANFLMGAFILGSPDGSIDFGDVAGLNVNPNVKFRYRALAVGFDYLASIQLGGVYTFGLRLNTFSLSIGLKL